MNGKKWGLKRKLDRDLVRLGAQDRFGLVNASIERVLEAFEGAHTVLPDAVNGHQGS